MEVIMADTYIINNLKSRKEEIKEELEFKDNESLQDELYEINDSLKKLGVESECSTNVL